MAHHPPDFVGDAITAPPFIEVAPAHWPVVSELAPNFLVDGRRLRHERYDLRPETYLRELAEPVQRRPLAERLAEVADLERRYVDLARTIDDLICRLSGPGAV